ncbi:glycoside hydrolase family 2 TIM barrel-domain containing protein [Ochrovirga pacifica]|uniref:glycoside hydrolase family 2 TIM barrel-domain containing protein n=1 Tax=Ochrovirga pacifica TaxID=1042376 RepID=UPI000255870A|nr:glycoside hydrolase family 2 TIM barrel-domain containing protein [Ochrovirga pacifica]
MKINFYTLLASVLLLFSCAKQEVKAPRTVEDFNANWKFSKEVQMEATNPTFDDRSWQVVQLPHDWTILSGYQKEGTAASTGFTTGGIGWYRKSFTIPKTDKEKNIWIEFDGIYNNTTVWINGHKLGFRPNGYVSFSYNLSDYLRFGEKNVIAVKVDHTNYVDSRWYTGSGIYRDVRLVKTSKTHIPQWGVKITTPYVTNNEAIVQIATKVAGSSKTITMDINIINSENQVVAKLKDLLFDTKSQFVQKIKISNPKLWGIANPNLYAAEILVKENGVLVDKVTESFGIRSIEFTADKGFLLNGKSVKIKGVNLHHDAGAVGAAATKATWEYRIKKLKSIGVNAIRMAHNPHSPLLMEVCDEQGMLVMNEFFDEWHHAKDKNKTCLGCDVAKEGDKGYSKVFLDWAERDLKSLIRRDYNHPSVIMWSIGNEIEWTFPYYSKAYDEINPNAIPYISVPEFDAEKIKPVFDKISGGIDSLALVAKQLSKWVKEEDTTRPVTCGSVRPSISMATGYGDAVDVMGFNYRPHNYDIAHKTYPNKPIIGSENWVAYSEWKAVADREFVAGIFMWTGFAYIGEAGPWPRKGLNISLFDFAGFKNPRGHFFECLWKPTPKVYMVTTPASESEFSYTNKEGWKFNMQYTAPPVWNKLRLWEWYKVNEYWDYKTQEPIVVQAYTNCEEAELFLNGKSLGKQQLSSVVDTDHILKWLVPYTKGELKVVGYNNGKIVDEYMLATTGKVSKIKLSVDKTTLLANAYDVAHVSIQLYDADGNAIRNKEQEVRFEVEGNAELVAVDNGWEMNVAPHNTNKVITHKGRALAIVKSTKEKGRVTICAKVGAITSAPIILNIN